MQPRALDGLTFGQRRARIAHLIAPVGPTPPMTAIAVPSMESLIAIERAKRETVAAPVEQLVAVAPAAPLALTLKITRERLAVFATLATIEQRPLEEVIAECLADMAAHLMRVRHRLHLDSQDQAQLDAYLDGLAAREERAEWEAEDHAARVATTTAMRAGALASNTREAFPFYHDDEQAEFTFRSAGAGYVETALAIEG